MPAQMQDGGGGRDAGADTGSGADGARTISSADLFGGAREVLIRHDGDVYRLRITRAGKLILNK